MTFDVERGIDAEIMRPFLSVHEDYIEAGFAAVDQPLAGPRFAPRAKAR